MEIKSENGLLTAYVYITPKPESDLEKIVNEGEKLIKENIKIPPGYYYQWSGQFEYYQSAMKDLSFIVPIIILLIVILVYLSLGKIFETFLVLLTLPSSLFGGFLLMYILDYKLSLASTAGFLALLGIAAEMGIIMVIYIMNSLREEKNKNLEEAIYDGAVKRIRPKAMTLMAIVAALLPAIYLKGVGAEVIALPMLGGVISAFITAIIVVPSLYSLRGR
ncbi:MAG: efflux RND transporter permease subunit [Brevinematia bacterium]